MSVCNVCSCIFEIESEGGIEGYFGIIPVEFCPTCLSSMFDMVEQLTDKPGWVGLTSEEVEVGLCMSGHAFQASAAWRDGVEWALKTLKEKNDE